MMHGKKRVKPPIGLEAQIKLRLETFPAYLNSKNLPNDSNQIMLV